MFQKVNKTNPLYIFKKQPRIELLGENDIMNVVQKKIASAFDHF